jgi:DNA-binding transcriptional MerR regulator
VDLFDDDLPQIPDRVYFTIGEASRLCGAKPHVLRYWEQEFEQLQPDKRRGNRRYYRYQDLIMIRRIRALVHQQGFTLSGAKLRIQEEDEARVEATHDDSKGMALREVIRELEQVRRLLSD